METPNTVLFLECYIQCQARRNSTPAIKTEGALRPRQVVSRFLVTARTKSEVWPLFVLRMRSQILRPFSRIINENLRIMHVFLRLQPWILDFAKILQTRATSGSAGT